MSSETPYRIPALSRTCRLLQLVADHGGEWNASELARALGVPRTTCFRMLRTLAQEGFLVAEGASYRLGPGLVRLGLSTLERLPWRRAGVPVLTALSRELGETTHLAMLCDDRSLLVEVADCADTTRVAGRPGTAVRIHTSATGKVLLAFLGKEEREALLSRMDYPAATARTITTRAALTRELNAVRLRGYAVDDEECLEGVRCVAVPVRDGSGEVVAALGLTGPAGRVTEESLPKLAGVLAKAAARIATAPDGGTTRKPGGSCPKS